MDDEAPKTLLITLTGKDRPGVTSAVFGTLAAAGVEVLDIEQIVLRRRLVLGLLVSAPRDWKKLRDAVEATAAAMDMHVEVDRGVGDNRALILNTPGELILAELSPAGYRQLAKQTVIGRTWANPAFADGCVFARNDTEIVCVPLK